MTFLVRPGVVATQVEDQLVLLEPASGVFFGLGGSAIAMWQLLPEHPDPNRLVEHLLQHYEVEPERLRVDVVSTLQRLEAAGLVQCSI